MLLRNHGIVVAGTSIEEACIRGVLLEHSAKTQVTAASMGAFSWASDADALLKRKRIYRPDAMSNLWEYFLRQLRQRQQPFNRLKTASVQAVQVVQKR